MLRRCAVCEYFCRAGGKPPVEHPPRPRGASTDRRGLRPQPTLHTYPSKKKQTYIRTSRTSAACPPPRVGPTPPPEASGDHGHGRLRGLEASEAPQGLRPRETTAMGAEGPRGLRGLALHSHARGSRPLASGLTSKNCEAIRHVGRGSSAGGKIVGGLSNSPPLMRSIAKLLQHALAALRNHFCSECTR